MSRVGEEFLKSLEVTEEDLKKEEKRKKAFEEKARKEKAEEEKAEKEKAEKEKTGKVKMTSKNKGSKKVIKGARGNTNRRKKDENYQEYYHKVTSKDFDIPGEREYVYNRKTGKYEEIYTDGRDRDD